MSYRTWTTDGFGFLVSDITDVKKDGLLSLLEKAPKFKAKAERILKDFHECDTIEAALENFNTEEIDDIFDYGDCGDTGLAMILREVINEATAIPDFATFVDDFDGNSYLLYCPSYPWSMSADEIGLTKEKAEAIFRNFISCITDSNVNIDYFSVGNGG